MPSAASVTSINNVFPRSRRRPVPTITEMGVVNQVREALRPKARLATALGFMLGGVVPLATYTVAHGEINPSVPLYLQAASVLVLGGLAYSAKTVYEWGCRAFGMKVKSLGFVVLIEGTMVISHTAWLGITALAYLIIINGLATGCALSLDSKR